MAVTVEAVEELLEVGRTGVGRHVTHGFADGRSGSALHRKTLVVEILRQVRCQVRHRLTLCVNLSHVAHITHTGVSPYLFHKGL